MKDLCKFKQLFALLAAMLLALCLSGCDSFFNSREDKIFTEKMDALINAINADDAVEVKALFSKSAIKSDIDLDSDIHMLFSVYPDSATVIYDGLLSGSYQVEDGKHKSTVYATVNIVGGNEYYWLYIELVYEDDFCPDNIGLSSVYLFTADEYCDYYHSEESEPLDVVGLAVFCELELENDVKCIQGFPYEWVKIERTVIASEVEEFLKSSTKLSEFKSAFGEANSTDEDENCYYEIIDGDGDIVYLELGVQNGQILYANILDEFSFLRSIIEEKSK